MTGTTGCIYQMVPVDDIELDLTNPRIAKWIEMYGSTITAEQMSLALGAGDSQVTDGSPTFYSLKESIKTNGGIIHPIIANKQDDGRLVAIEGNTRALIYREFRDQNVPGDWTRIPTMVYTGLSLAEVDAIRLQAHLVGPRQWEPYSKAKYLDHLRNTQHLTFAQVVDFCGGKKREVQDYIAAYHDMETYYRPLLESDDQFDPTRFSSFVELQRPRIQEAILAHGYSKTDFARWVRDQLLSPQMMVRNLPRILDNPKSREVFLADGAQEAMKTIDVPSDDEALRNAPLDHLAREISRRVLNMAYSELQRLRSHVGSEENQVICEARDQLTQLCSDIAAEE